MNSTQQTADNLNWKRNAGFFIGGQFASMFGSMLVQYAITWHITLQTKSGVMMTVFTCAALLPMVFISPFAGVWADRYNRKYLINAADGAIAIVTLILAVAYIGGMKNIWLMLVVILIRSLGQGVQQPSVSAIVPQIVPEDQLARFNGIQSAVQSFTMFAAPMISGALLTFLPIEHIFFIDVITAAIGISVVFFCVKVSGVPGAREIEPGVAAYYRELMEGFRFIGNTKWLKILFVYMAFFSVFVTPAAMLTPLQVARSFGDDVWRLTAVDILFSVGMMLGGVVMSVWGGFKNKVHTMILACFAFGATTVLFGVVPDFWMYSGVMLLCGSVMPMFNTPMMTVMQTKIQPRFMGRVFSAVTMIGGVAMPVGMSVFGPLGDWVRIETLLVGTGTVLFLSGFVLCGCKSLIAEGM
jgi:DHA3 family macrolide efflux protein-like MFS transporter